MPKADLVLEGGGVKGTGLVGALTALVNRPDPYEFYRIAGTSAGAIVASFLAAGISPAELKTIMTDLDFSEFEDESGVLKHLKLFGEGFGLLFHEGLFAGDFMHSWVARTLASKGVTTWKDLKIDDDTLPENERYKLVVVVSDVSRGLELRLPWDFQDVLGIDPDTQLVADAVRASASIPFFFRGFHLPASKTHSDGNGYVLCTDGGMLSNYPIDIFDKAENARWPTLGVKLSARAQITAANWSPNSNGLELAKALVGTMADAHDQLHVGDPYYSSRTIFVDTTGFSSTNFHLTDADKSTLFDHGVAAGTSFLQTWNYETWRAQYPGRAPRPPAGTPDAVAATIDVTTGATEVPTQASPVPAS
jgi:NTE family protein